MTIVTIIDKVINVHNKKTTSITKTILGLVTFETDYNSDNWEPEFMAIFVIWQWIVTLDSIHNSCDVFCPTTIVTTIINLYGGRTSDKTFSSSQVVFSSTVVTTLFPGPEKHCCIRYDWHGATFEGEIAVIPSIGIDMKCVNPSITFGEVCHSFWCRPTNNVSGRMGSTCHAGEAPGSFWLCSRGSSDRWILSHLHLQLGCPPSSRWVLLSWHIYFIDGHILNFHIKSSIPRVIPIT